MPLNLNAWWDTKYQAHKYDYVYNKTKRGGYARFQRIRDSLNNKYMAAVVDTAAGRQEEGMCSFLAGLE